MLSPIITIIGGGCKTSFLTCTNYAPASEVTYVKSKYLLRKGFSLRLESWNNNVQPYNDVIFYLEGGGDKLNLNVALFLFG